MKRHMVFWEGSGAKVDSQKKFETPHGFLGRFWVQRSAHKKKLEAPHGFLGRSLLRRSTHKKILVKWQKVSKSVWLWRQSRKTTQNATCFFLFCSLGLGEV